MIVQLLILDRQDVKLRIEWMSIREMLKIAKELHIYFSMLMLIVTPLISTVSKFWTIQIIGT